MRTNEQSEIEEPGAFCTPCCHRSSGGVIQADAATLNGHEIKKGDAVTNDFVAETAQSGKFLIGQGDLNIQTDATVGGTLNKLPGDLSNIGGVIDAFNPTKDNAPLVGVVGGEMQIDSNTASFWNKNKDMLSGALGDKAGMIDKVFKANTAGGDSVEKTGDVNITVGSKEHNPLVIGFVGGDASLNTGLNGKLGNKLTEILAGIPEQHYTQQDTSVNRTGNITGTISSGNVLVGVGGSAAAAIGNVNAKVGNGYLLNLNLGSADKATTASTVVNGNVKYNVNDTANLGVWANGGGAVALGGNASSTVTETSTLTIDHTGLTTDKIDGVSGLIAGGGASISTLGGKAETSTGATYITVNNSLTGLVAGGGAAVSFDPSAVYNNLAGRNDGKNGVGNDDGTSDFDIAEVMGQKVIGTISHAIDGGTAKATTGDTHISLNGSSTAIITAGGGVAGAWHSYTNRDNTDNNTENNGFPGGTSQAKTESGNVTIDVNLDTKGGADALTGVKNAVSTIKNIIGGKSADVLIDLGKSANALSGKGMAVGILGGGVATSVSDGGTTTSSTVKDVTINLNKGYTVGTFGGGLSVNQYNKWSKPVTYESGQMKAYTEANSVQIKVAANGADDNAVGVFGGGVAVSGEYGAVNNTVSGKYDLKPVAESVVKGSADIKVTGKADGVYGGGLAVSTSNVVGTDKGGVDALASVGTANISVSGGTVNTLNLAPIMQAVKNTNGTADADPNDKYQTGDNAWWSFLGQNASRAMADLKGITDSTAIAGGGMSLGMSSKADVTNVNIAVSAGTVNGDIIGGGIAVDNMNKDAGAAVDTANIKLTGGTVKGSVYAGGAVNGTTPDKMPTIGGNYQWYGAENTASTVKTAAVTLSGTDVTGEISGQGYAMTTKYAGDGIFNPFYDGTAVGDKVLTTYDKALYKESVKNSTLVLSGENTLSALDNSKKIYTSDSKIHDFNTVTAEAGSVTKVTGDVTKNALISGGKVTVGNGAKLNISELTSKNSTIKIAAGTDKGSSFWGNEALRYDRTKGYADRVAPDTNESYDLTYKTIETLSAEEKTKAAREITHIMDIGATESIVDNALQHNMSDVNGGFIKIVRDGTQNEGPYNKAFLIGEDAAATGNAVSITRDMADNVYQRLSFTEDPVTKAGVANETGDIWAKYIHNEYKTSGQASSFSGISGDNTYDGAIVGVDLARKGNVQYGAAFHYGSGDGNGTISKNDFDAYGFTLYGSVKDEAAGTNLMADIGYAKTSNDITGHVNGKSVTADRDITAWTVGVRGEKEFVQGRNQIVPYAGLRYMSVNPSAYDSYYDGEKLFHNDGDNQNLWFLPVGVSLRNETVTKSGWRVVPKVEVAYIWAFGDKDGNVDVDLGTGTASPLFYTVTDDGSWLTSLAVEASRGVWSYGAGYTYQKGDDTKNQKWFVNASYAF